MKPDLIVTHKGRPERRFRLTNKGDIQFAIVVDDNFGSNEFIFLFGETDKAARALQIQAILSARFDGTYLVKLIKEITEWDK